MNHLKSSSVRCLAFDVGAGAGAGAGVVVGAGVGVVAGAGYENSYSGSIYDVSILREMIEK